MLPEPITSYIEQTSVNISCHASGLPAPDVTWIRGSDGFKYPSQNSSSSLVFISVDRSAAGQYRCEAKSSPTFASDTVTITLTVHCKSYV